MSILRTAFVSLAGVACAGPALALGTFVAPSGDEVRLVASRNIVIRHADRVQIVSQVRYDGAPAELVWLLPIPNFNEPADDGVRVEAFGQGGFDELEERTRPVLRGTCDGEPNGMQASVIGPDFGPAPNMALPSRPFIVPDIIAGDLNDYLTTTLGLTVGESVQAAIDGMVDQNFMIYAVRFDADAVGVDRVDPIVSISYPLAAGQNPKIPLLPLASAVGAGGTADLRLFIFDKFRVQSNLRTSEVDAAQIAFTDAVGTNYDEAFAAALAPVQTQGFVVEFAGDVGAIDDATLAQAVTASGATTLTRLRTAMTEPALRNNVTTTLREAGAQAPVSNTRDVAGFQCGGPVTPDMGTPPPADMGVTPDMGGATADGGPSADGGAGGAGGDDGGGGGGGGCDAFGGQATGTLALFGLLGLTLTLRRRRT